MTFKTLFFRDIEAQDVLNSKPLFFRDIEALDMLFLEKILQQKLNELQCTIAQCTCYKIDASDVSILFCKIYGKTKHVLLLFLYKAVPRQNSTYWFWCCCAGSLSCWLTNSPAKPQPAQHRVAKNLPSVAFETSNAFLLISIKQSSAIINDDSSAIIREKE